MDIGFEIKDGEVIEMVMFTGVDTEKVKPEMLQVFLSDVYHIPISNVKLISDISQKVYISD